MSFQILGSVQTASVLAGGVYPPAFQVTGVCCAVTLCVLTLVCPYLCSGLALIHIVCNTVCQHYATVMQNVTGLPNAKRALHRTSACTAPGCDLSYQVHHLTMELRTVSTSQVWVTTHCIQTDTDMFLYAMMFEPVEVGALRL